MSSSTISSLIQAVKVLYPIPRKHQPASFRPTRDSLDAFLVAQPDAREALVAWPRSGEGQSLAWDLGWVALWTAEKLDGLVRELEGRATTSTAGAAGEMQSLASGSSSRKREEGRAHSAPSSSFGQPLQLSPSRPRPSS